MSSDIDRLRRDVSLPDYAASCGVSLEKDGYEWVGCCPFHNENTPSFTIFPGKDGVMRFHCFGCDAKGDILDFVKTIKGVGTREAIAILSGGGDAVPNVPARKVEARDIYAGITPLDPAGEIVVGRRVRLYNPKRAGKEWEWGSFTPSMVFPYCRADGALVGYVLRRDLPDGGKETPMVMWVRLPDGTECWSRFPFPRPRPLYGLHKLRAGQVIVVEGEKCRDALAKATGRNVVTWPGGTYGIAHTDWKSLEGRSIVIWPDADAPGIATAEKIAGIVRDLGATVKMLNVMGRA